MNWNSVVFSDYSKFHLEACDDTTRTRRRHGERQNFQFSIEQQVHRTVGIMVWYCKSLEIVWLLSTITMKYYKYICFPFWTFWLFHFINKTMQDLMSHMSSWAFGSFRRNFSSIAYSICRPFSNRTSMRYEWKKVAKLTTPATNIGDFA